MQNDDSVIDYIRERLGITIANRVAQLMRESPDLTCQDALAQAQSEHEEAARKVMKNVQEEIR